MTELVLVVNTGSASRKYALYDKRTDKLLVSIHFEQVKNGVQYSLFTSDQSIEDQMTSLAHVSFASSLLMGVLQQHDVIEKDARIVAGIMRIVAPSSYFQQNHVLTKSVLNKLRELEQVAPLHIGGLFQEIELLARYVPGIKLVGISDSAFHRTMPFESRAYAIPQGDAKKLDIYRYGYHGIALSATTQALKKERILSAKTIVCHLGSGASVTALFHGASRDTTMGYSPLEGLTMATRSGSIDPLATAALKRGLGLTELQLDQYLNSKSGLLGLSGRSSDIRDLVAAEQQGSQAAKDALNHFVVRVQKAVGQMAAMLNGVDALVFTGTIGERSAVMRKRIIAGLGFLGFYLELSTNTKTTKVTETTVISAPRQSHPVYVIHADETAEMYRQALELLQ